MSVKQGKIFSGALKIAVVALFSCGLLARCASVAHPQGGPRDTLPPVVLSVFPENGAVNFDAKRVTITFDEFIQLKNQFQEVYTSPFMKSKPSITMRGKTLIVDIKDTLQPNTTYSINFGSSVADNNEGNPLNGFRYVLSTGDAIDSLVMSGYTVDAYTKDTMPAAFIYFYEAWRDSIPEYDSTLVKHKPDVVARAFKNGIFIAENLKPVDYRVYAVLDANNSQRYVPGQNKVAFLDSTYNPAAMEPFDVWYDTLRMQATAEPQLYFRMFMDEPFRRQVLAGSARPEQNRFIINFGDIDPEIMDISFSNLDTSLLVREYLKPTRDSVAYWINMPAESIPDTIRGQVIYMKHDSLNRLVPDTARLSLSWKKAESRQQERARKQREEEIAKAAEEGREPDLPAEPNPFQMSQDISGGISPQRPVAFSFGMPLVKADKDSMSLVMIAEDKETSVGFTFTQDTLQVRTWYLGAKWEDGAKYRFRALPGTFVNVAGQANDSLSLDINILRQEELSYLSITVTGKTPQSVYVMQLLDQNNRMLDEKRDVRTGLHTFDYVPAGTVKLRVIEDMNGNGVWDKGNVIKRIQPERVEMYLGDTGEPDISTRANWGIDLNIDMNELFGPVTIENLMRQIRAIDEKLAEKLREARAKRLEQDRQRQGGSNSSFNPTSGFGF